MDIILQTATLLVTIKLSGFHINMSRKKVHVLIISDATGITAERVISAALVQFKEIKPIFKRFPIGDC